VGVDVLTSERVVEVTAAREEDRQRARRAGELHRGPPEFFAAPTFMTSAASRKTALN
jgi:hypothetical protein